jgi:hypothetical protein
MQFWNLVSQNPGLFDLFISDEIKKELEVQSYNIGKENTIIKALLQSIRLIESSADDELVHAVRVVSAHIRKYYNLPRFDRPDKQMRVPSYYDAKIILTALEHECAIVTRNVKDFMIFSCIQQEHPVWDPVTNSTGFIPEHVQAQWKHDVFVREKFNDILTVVNHFKQ